jgi:small redox-active disulfide protein 2
MLIQVLGSGCQKCNDLYANARAAAERSPGAGHEVVKVDDVDTFFRLGVTRTPALVLDGTVVASGKVLDAGEIAELIAAHTAGE